jgi:putative CRISPR-associated protein (TIGR02619 family)
VRTYVLTTVGVSLLGQIRKKFEVSDGKLPDEREVVAFLRQHEPEAHECGAEINSLAALLSGTQLSNGTPEAPAAVQLLVSDTDEGEWVGKVLCQYLPKWQGPKIEDVQMARVSKLNGENYKSFANHGLKSLVTQAIKCLKGAETKWPEAKRVINATGGYKAQISFAGLIGQVMRVPVVYLFEHFARCIELQPLPVAFDRGLWLGNYWLFEELENPEEMVEWRRVCDYQVDKRIADLLNRVEIDGKEYVELSPILALLHQGFKSTLPDEMAQPPDSDLAPADKLKITPDHHLPKGAETRFQQLAELPWVKRVETIRLVNTPTLSRVKSGGNIAAKVNEVFFIHGDGDMGVEIRLITTCSTDAERNWCLEELRTVMS